MERLSTDLAVSLNEFLVARNLRDSNIKITDSKFTEFSEYELGSITELCIKNSYDISELDKLPNLSKLHIKSADYNKIAPSLDYESSPVINHIKDFSVLSKLNNLEELVVANDLYVDKIDLTGMPKLQKLILVNNPNLTTLIGLDKLKNLNEVTMYGNDISGENFDFDAYVQNTYLCVENTLDISMYLGIINNNRDKAKLLEEYEIKGLSFVRFAEKSGFLNCVCLSLRDLYEMYSKLDIYFRSSHAYDLTESEQIEFVHRYIIRNTKFDKRLIIDRNIAFIADKAQYNEMPDKLRKRYNNIHSSFYTYKFKIGNCEGRTNLSVFMYRMLGIDAYNVHCHDNRSPVIGSNHSITRINTNNNNLYIDASLGESLKNDPNIKEILLKNGLTGDISDISKLFFCVDYDFMSEYVTLDSYEYSLSKNTHNTYRK